MVDAGIRGVKTYSYLVKEVGGAENVGFTQRDCQNFINKRKMNLIERGDAQTVMTHFKHRLAEDPLFFHSEELDDDRRLANCFWRDGRSKLDYDCFGDVVVFDTTYRTNRYNMIFAPFVGINHHWKNILFGCAFLLDETTDAFIWLFETFLQMSLFQARRFIWKSYQMLVRFITIACLRKAIIDITMWSLTLVIVVLNVPVSYLSPWDGCAGIFSKYSICGGRITKIPAPYILIKWTKFAKKEFLMHGHDKSATLRKSSLTIERNNLIQMTHHAINHLVLTDEGREVVRRKVAEMWEETKRMENINNGMSIDDDAISNAHEIHSRNEELRILDPRTVREKGVTNARKKSYLEKKKRKQKGGKKGLTTNQVPFSNDTNSSAHNKSPNGGS